MTEKVRVLGLRGTRGSIQLLCLTTDPSHRVYLPVRRENALCRSLRLVEEKSPRRRSARLFCAPESRLTPPHSPQPSACVSYGCCRRDERPRFLRSMKHPEPRMKAVGKADALYEAI
jgi:hypothetical protein